MKQAVPAKEKQPNAHIRLSKDTDVGLRFFWGLGGCVQRRGDPFRYTACSPRGRKKSPTMERSKRQQEAEHTTESIENPFHSVLLSCVLRSGVYQPQANSNIRLYVSPTEGPCAPIRKSGRYTRTHQRVRCDYLFVFRSPSRQKHIKLFDLPAERSCTPAQTLRSGTSETRRG
jgi:hypothetical protein